MTAAAICGARALQEHGAGRAAHPRAAGRAARGRGAERDALATGTRLDDVAFIGKRRDAILRVAPGMNHADFRAKFGLDRAVRANQPSTLMSAAQRLLAGKKAMPTSRAAQLITAADAKRLRAIVQSIRAPSGASTWPAKAARAGGTSQADEGSPAAMVGAGETTV